MIQIDVGVNLFLNGRDDNQYEFPMDVPNNFESWSEEKKEEYIEHKFYSGKFQREVIRHVCVSRGWR